VAAFGETGGDAEVLKKLGVVCSVHDAPQSRNGLGAAKFDTVGPEAGGPVGVVRGKRLEGGSGRTEGG
jgi:hypothetical protein